MTVSHVERITPKMRKDWGIKPCPFCASENLLLMEEDNVRMADGSAGWRVFCQMCGCSLGLQAHADAIEGWNRRKWFG